MKRFIFVFACFVFVCFVWFSSGSVSLAESFEAPNGHTYNHHYTFRRFRSGYNSFSAEFFCDYKIGMYDGFAYYIGSDGQSLYSMSLVVPGTYTNQFGTDYISTTYLSGMEGRSQNVCFTSDFTDQSTNMPSFETREELIDWLNAPDIDFSEAVYTPDMGHLVGIDKGFKRYSLSGVNYMQLSWFSETSGGFELLDDYYDDSFVEIKIIPTGLAAKRFSNKFETFYSLNSSVYF